MDHRTDDTPQTEAHRARAAFWVRWRAQAGSRRAVEDARDAALARWRGQNMSRQVLASILATADAVLAYEQPHLLAHLITADWDTAPRPQMGAWFRPSWAYVTWCERRRVRREAERLGLALWLN